MGGGRLSINFVVCVLFFLSLLIDQYADFICIYIVYICTCILSQAPILPPQPHSRALPCQEPSAAAESEANDEEPQPVEVEWVVVDSFELVVSFVLL